MIPLMDWIAQDAKHFFGTLVFICVLAGCLIEIVKALRGATS